MAWSEKLKNDIRMHREGGCHVEYLDNDENTIKNVEDSCTIQTKIDNSGGICSGDDAVLSLFSLKQEKNAKIKQTPHHHFHGNIMKLIIKLCHEIVAEYPTGHTECFYEKVLAQYLYERSIPCITQVDCFVQRKFSQILVGRIDMEVAHSVLLELKVAPKIKQTDIDQLWKYIRAKRACGMVVEHAAVICFCTSPSCLVDIHEANLALI